MRKDKAFALTVQTIVLVQERCDEHMSPPMCASIVAHAASLPEEAIPRMQTVDAVDPSAACHFVAWYLGQREKPEWVP